MKFPLLPTFSRITRPRKFLGSFLPFSWAWLISSKKRSPTKYGCFLKWWYPQSSHPKSADQFLVFEHPMGLLGNYHRFVGNPHIQYLEPSPSKTCFESHLLKAQNIALDMRISWHEGGFKHFLFSSLFGEDSQFWLIFFKGVETTSQMRIPWYGPFWL